MTCQRRLLPLLALSVLVFIRVSADDSAAEDVALNDIENFDLASLSSSELSALEERLTREVSESDAQLEALRRDTDDLRSEQEQIDLDAEALREAREEEAKRKEERDRELDMAKKEVHSKQASIARMGVRLSDLRKQVGSLEHALHDLLREKEETERRYNDPSIADVLESRSENWGNVQKNLYNKTMHEIVPAISELSGIAERYRMKVSRTSRALELLASALVYSFVIGSGYAMYVLYKRVKGKLTVGKLLLVGDTFCAVFWLLILVCYMFLFNDPLRVIQSRSPRLFFVFQLCALSTYISYVFLRVLVLASHLTFIALVEVLSVIVIGQHYYVRVWQPAILGEKAGGTFFFYLCYACVFCSFAVKRTESLDHLQKLRGKAPLLLTFFRDVSARLTNSALIRGGLQSFPCIPVYAVPEQPAKAMETRGH